MLRRNPGYLDVVMDQDRRNDTDEETIAPDIAPRDELPLEPGQAVRRERDKYGDSSTNPNRDDQLDEHSGTFEDIV